MSYWSAIGWSKRMALKAVGKSSGRDGFVLLSFLSLRLPDRHNTDFNGFFSSRNTEDPFVRVPQLGNTAGPVSPTNPFFTNRSTTDFEKGGLSLTTTREGEKDGSASPASRKSGIAVKVERNVVNE